MHVPYTNEELDNLIRACIEFTVDHEKYFYAANISGRQGVVADSDVAKRMMEWIVDLDKGILQYKGFGLDNLEYFQLGYTARKMMEDGGFARYLRRKRVAQSLEHVREWSPIFISSLALVVSVLAWQAPKSSSKKIDELSAQVVELRVHSGETQSALETMQKKLDSKMLPNNGVQPTRKRPRG